MNPYLEKMQSLEYYYVRGNIHEAASQENLKKLETQIGYSLPTEYTEFVLSYGGCGFEEYVDFPFIDDYSRDDRGLISVFFGIMPEDSYDLSKNYSMYRGRIPRNMLPIAGDPGGNIIGLVLSGKEQNRVYFWDHSQELPLDEEAEFGQIDIANLYLLATSFQNFIDSLAIAEE